MKYEFPNELEKIRDALVIGLDFEETANHIKRKYNFPSFRVSDMKQDLGKILDFLKFKDDAFEIIKDICEVQGKTNLLEPIKDFASFYYKTRRKRKAEDDTIDNRSMKKVPLMEHAKFEQRWNDTFKKSLNTYLNLPDQADKNALYAALVERYENDYDGLMAACESAALKHTIFDFRKLSLEERIQKLSRQHETPPYVWRISEGTSRDELRNIVQKAVKGDKFIVPESEISFVKKVRDDVHVRAHCPVLRTPSIPADCAPREWLDRYAKQQGMTSEVKELCLKYLPADQNARHTASSRTVRFHTLTVSGIGPFKDKFQYLISPGVHMVTSEVTSLCSNGFGKSTLSITAFLWCLSNHAEKRAGGKPIHSELLNHDAKKGFVQLVGDVKQGGAVTEFEITRKIRKQKGGKTVTTLVFRWNNEEEEKEQVDNVETPQEKQKLLAKNLFGIEIGSTTDFRDYLLSTMFWSRFTECGFLDMEPQGWRNFLYGLLDHTDIWDNAQKMAKEDASNARAEHTRIKNKLNDEQESMKSCQVELSTLRKTLKSFSDTKDIKQLQKEKKQLEKNKQQCEQEKLKLQDKKDLPSELKELLLESESAKQSVKQLQAKHQQCSSEIQDITKKITSTKKKQTNIRKLLDEAKCPKCYQGISKDVVNAQIAKLKQKITTLTEEQESLKQEQEKLMKKQSSAETTFNEKLHCFDTAKQKASSNLDNKIQQLSEDIGKLSSKIEAAKVTQENIDSTRTQLETHQDNIRSLEEQLKDADTKIELLTKVCLAFADTGIQTLIRSEMIQEFEKYINIWISRFYYDIDPVEVLVHSNQNNSESLSSQISSLQSSTQSLKRTQSIAPDGTKSNAHFQIHLKEEPQTHRILKTVKWINSTEQSSLSTLSTAEYMRTHLSFFLAYRNLLQQKQMVKTNLLVFDECFSGVDQEGTMCILEALNVYAANEVAVFFATVSPLYQMQFEWQQLFILTERGNLYAL